MEYYDEEFYDEPSEFDIKIQELKESLANSIKADFFAEMERLKQENSELQKVKQDWESIQREYRDKHRQLEVERRDLARTVRRERLDVLMQDFHVIMFRAHSTRPIPPKCNKCDEHRRIEYITPLGRKSYEECDCNVGHTVYVPDEYVASSFSIDRNGKKLDVWYKKSPFKDSDSYQHDTSEYAKVIYKSGMDYETLKTYDTFFTSKEDCQAYCDYLNYRSDNK